MNLLPLTPVGLVVGFVLWRQFAGPRETWFWNLRRQGVPRYYLTRPGEAFARWGKTAAMRAWAEITDRQHRDKRVYPAPDWEWRRIAVRDRDGERCEVCGRGDRPSDSLHTHHRLPYGQGGTHALENLAL